jgi:IS5 family transposase
MCAVIKRQRTVVGRLVREVGRKAAVAGGAAQTRLNEALSKAQRIADQSRSRKNIDGVPKLYAWH